VVSGLILQPEVKHIILIFTSVSDEDTTALEALESLNHEFKKPFLAAFPKMGIAETDTS
jgi:hypothetical protein